MSFIAKFLDDREKSVNPVHVMMGLLVLASISWVTFLVIKNHTMPELTGVATLLGGGGIANACQKAEDIVAKFKKPTVDPVEDK
jgi:hypothetical protein